MRSVLLACLLLAGSAGTQEKRELKITSPAAGATLAGDVTLEVHPGALGDLASVEFSLDGRALREPVLAPPYRLAWNSAETWDGPASLRAVARDRQGQVLSESDPVGLIIANGPTQMKVLSPEPGKVLKGKVSWTVEVDLAKAGSLEAVMFTIDGITPDNQVHYLGQDQKKIVVTQEIDTEQLEDGLHDFFASTVPREGQRMARAKVQLLVSVENGHVPLELRPRWRDLFLEPGQSARLDPSRVYADGTGELLGTRATYLSESPLVARVDPEGTVTGMAEGIARILISSEGQSAATRVIVRKGKTFPHFSRRGKILQSFVPGESVFVRSMFNLSPEELSRLNGLAARVKAAGVNALETGFYSNPADCHAATLETWKSGWTEWWNATVEPAKAHGFGIVATGDAIFRSEEERADTQKNPWAAEAIRHCFERISKDGIVISIEMQDEVGGPVTPDFKKLMKLLRPLPGRPPITWPVAAICGEDIKAWMGDPAMSDYATLYWTYARNAWREPYPWGGSLASTRENLDAVVVERLPDLQLGRPRMMLVSCSGPFYTKLVPGDEYQAGKDAIQAMGTSPAVVSAQILYAASMGMCGVRLYGYDGPWKEVRRETKIGEGGIQTGASPVAAGQDRWGAISAAFGLIEKLEPLFLSPERSSLDLGPSFVTGARESQDQRLLVAINCSEAPRKALIDLSPYRHPEAANATGYRLLGSSLSAERVGVRKPFTVVFAPGEVRVWVLESKP